MAAPTGLPILVIAGFPEGIARGLARRLPDLAVQTVATAEAAATAAAGARIVVLDEALAGEATDELLERLGQGRTDLGLICALRARPPLARMLRMAGELRVAKILYHPVDREELALTVAELAGVPLPPPAGDDDSADLEEIWVQHRDDVLTRVGTLERAIVGLLEGHLDAQLAADARREAHTLAGSVALFGFAHASALAREIETAFRSSVPQQQDAPRLARLAVELRTELEASVATPAVPASSATGDAVLLLITQDPVLGPNLAAALTGRGLRTRTCDDLNDADRLARRPHLRAVVVDLALEGGGEPALDVVRRLSLDPNASPVIALGVSDSTEERVTAARARAAAFITRSTPATEIAHELVTLLGESSGRIRVLAVDDDVATAQAIRAMLEPRFDVVTLNEPLRFWDVLEESRPDLVLLDLNMPVVNGIELCRTLRSDPRWARLPVLFLTSLTDDETMSRIFAAGADDFVAKPVRDVELAARIANRIDRVRAFARPSDVDALTGAHTRGFLYARLTERLASSGRRAACALAAVRVEGFGTVRDLYGAATADRVLIRLGELLMATFRGDDLVARLGHDRFGVLMGGLDREGAQQRALDFSRSLAAERFGGREQELTVSMKIGIATSADGEDADALLRQAEQEAEGRTTGEARVETEEQSERPEVTPTVDVVVVDDDRALSNLLVHGLRARGYSVEWYADGNLAAAALAGSSPPVRPRVILLDVDLPGLDGHSLLRQMAADGVLATARVIMLTLRSNEPEVLAALQGGAFDHVAKPFSMPILIERVRRALETAH